MERLARCAFFDTAKPTKKKLQHNYASISAPHNMLSRHLSLLQSDFWQEPIFCLAACAARRLIVSVEQEVVVVFSLQPAAGDIAYIHTARACCDIYPLDNLFDQRVNALWTDLRAMIIRRTPHSGGHHTTSRVELFMAPG
jgi:hypothetical protein